MSQFESPTPAGEVSPNPALDRPKIFKLALPERDYGQFVAEVLDQQGQTLKELSDRDPNMAYELIIAKSISTGTVNGVTRSPGRTDAQDTVGRELQKRIYNPGQQAVRVEVYTWGTPTKPKADVVSKRILSFCVGPLEQPE